MNVAHTAGFMGKSLSSFIKIIVFCMLFVQLNAHAGFVLGRGVINSKDGNTLWAEYNANGGYIILDAIDPSTGNRAHTIAGSTLLSYQSQLQAYETRNPNSQYLTKSDFDSIEITALNGKPFNKPIIPEEAKIVVLPAADKILTEKYEFIEYIWLPYDIKLIGDIEATSYLISESGEVLYESKDEGSSIGPLNGYYYPEDDDGNLVIEQKEYEGRALPFSSNRSNQLINPVPGVMISGFGNKKSSSASDGWINASALTECPNSNLGSSLGAQAASNAILGIIASAPPITLGARLPFVGFSATEPKQRAYFAYGLIGMCDYSSSNIFVSMQSVMGGAQIFNPDAGIVPISAKTSFHLDTQRNETTYLSSIDFDGDGIKDPASYLKYDETEKTYTPVNANSSNEATHMGVYFTTGVETDPATNLAIPSIIRAVDRIAQHKNKGLLKTINTVDLAQTDLFVFRVSSGQLVTSHKGIEQATRDDNYTQGGTFNDAFNFQFVMRGPDDYWNAFNPYPDYAGWASLTKVTEPFQKRKADHIRPGEQLQLIAINRASGYIGSVKFTSKQVGVGGDISNALDSIIMRPPNLKIWAERVHEIKQGKQVAGEDERTNLIGNEGITLESDLAVSVHTEWLDYDGLPLPTELGDFGYTARIAKVTSAPTPDLDALKQNNTNEFAIKPGRNLNVLQFNQKELSRHHFYVQVNPYPKSEQNDFGSEIYNPLHKNYLPDGSGDDEHDLPDVDNVDLEGNETSQKNPLRYRPAHYVPFKVPLYDEQYSQIQQDIYDDLKEQGKAENLEKPDPLYRWYYRPELQFSQYNFDAKSLIVNQTDGEGEESITEIEIEDEGTDFGPIFDDYTDSVDLLFDLLGPELDRLPPLENDREFVLSLGGEEAIATIGADGKVTFENPEHLTQLTEEDLLSLRLYLNGDAGNVLWEYAFQPLFINTGLKPARYGDTVYVNADQPEIELSAFLLFPDEDEDYRLIWTVEEGSGTISRSVQPLISGSATTTLSLTPHINNLVKVSAALADEPDNKVFSSKIGVLPGMPSQLSIINAEGEIFEHGMGEYKVQVSVKDAHSNDVSDGLPVSFITDGSLYVAKQKSTTFNGAADAILKGAYKPGNYKLNIQAGSGNKTQKITVKGLTKEFINMPTSAIAGESYSAQIQVSAAGQPAINTYIQLGISGAILEQSQLKTDENGLINFIIHTPIKGGLVSVSAKTGFDNELKANFTVSAPTQELKTSKTFTLANTSLSNQTITMTGSPNQAWQLDFDQTHFPNRSPLYLNRFYDLRNDDNYKYLAEHNAQRSNDGPEYGLFSLDLKEDEQGASEWQLLYKEELAPQLPAIAFWLKTSADGKVVSTVDGKVNLTLNAGTLDLSLETASQTLQLSQAGLVHGQWYQVAFGLQADHAYLSVNEDITQQSIATTMSWEGTVDAAWLTIGDGFVGKVSGLRLYDWASTPLLKLSETNGIYAANGETVINLEAQSASQIYNTSVVIKSDSGHSVPITILAEDNYQKYRTAITNIYGAGDNVQDHISLAQYFPSIDQPMQSLFSEVSNNDDLGALESVLVASSWLGMRNELSDIEPHLIALQNYYRQHDQHELVFALADELSQSLMNAQAGNNLRLMSLRTGLLVWGEVLAASPQAADVIATGIQNKTDLWTWLRYLSLPAEGWAGEIIPIPLPHNTCDKVDPEINIGTILEYSSIPCRVTGTLAAEVINNWVDADSEIAANKRLLTRQIEIITAGLKGAPLEITKQVFLSGTTTNIASNWSPLPEAHANPAVAAGRLVVFALKTGAKAGFGNAPPNLMNFFKNRTTSRFQAHEILAAIAYLESRREGGEFACEGCKFINEEVFEQINKNLRAWFNGLSLVNNGEIPNEAKQQRMCTLTNQAHGAALELVGTAAYHALYEFGSSVGVTDSDKYEILSADQYIRIPLRDKEDGEYRRIADGDYGRVPDLIMKGRGEFKRYWIEFKSWRKGVGFTRRADGSSSINPWKLSIKTSNQYPHAHKQHFLDYVATQGKLTDVWKDDVDLQRGKYTIDRVTNLDLRAGTNRTWVQVWEKEHDARGYQPLTKVNDKWKIGDTVYIKRANPWISAKAKDIITDTEISSSGFDLVQQYLTQAPSKIRNQEFKTTVGYPLANHYERYAKNQIGKNSSTVAPFTLANMLAIEVGEDAGKKIAKKLTEQIANSDFAEYLGAGDLSTEQIAELRDKVQESVQQQMGKLGEVSAAIDEYTPQIWLDFEEALQSQVAGAMGDDIREALENFELPESLQDQFCEAVVQ